mmetsp:Transcript_8373/g.25171  ORF Transcript_8373/g.25171 Transcript_8373/m.25171 type:complete len:159 (+) Transcript_8373:55-531(+)
MSTTAAYVPAVLGLPVSRRYVRCCALSEGGRSRRDLMKLLALGGACFLPPLGEVLAKPLNPAYPDKKTDYIPKGFPEEQGPLPSFEEGKEVEHLANGFSYQDVLKGSGKLVSGGCLAVAHWRVRLENGNEVINTRIEGKPIFFRVVSRSGSVFHPSTG